MATAAIIGGGIAVGAAAGQYLSAREGAKATEKQVAAQGDIARRGLAFQKQTRKMAMEAAEPSVGELMAIQNLVSTREVASNKAEALLANQEQQLASLDPSIVSAGEQLLSLLQGKEAESLGFLKKQRTQERSQLESRLQENLGSGYATSSAGIEALSRFDEQSDRLAFDTQQTSIANLLQTQAGLGQIKSNMLQDVGRFGQIAGGLSGQEIAARQNISARRVSAIQGTPVSFQSVMQTAAPGAIGDIARAKAKQDMFGQVAQVGSTVATAGALRMDGGGGGGTMTASPSPGTQTGTFGNVAGGMPRRNPYQ